MNQTDELNAAKQKLEEAMESIKVLENAKNMMQAKVSPNYITFHISLLLWILSSFIKFKTD